MDDSTTSSYSGTFRGLSVMLFMQWIEVKAGITNSRILSLMRSLFHHGCWRCPPSQTCSCRKVVHIRTCMTFVHVLHVAFGFIVDYRCYPTLAMGRLGFASRLRWSSITELRPSSILHRQEGLSRETALPRRSKKAAQSPRGNS
jgi:hypothetical protein